MENQIYYDSNMGKWRKRQKSQKNAIMAQNSIYLPPDIPWKTPIFIFSRLTTTDICTKTLYTSWKEIIPWFQCRSLKKKTKNDENMQNSIVFQ